MASVFRFEHGENWGSSLYEYVSLLMSLYCEVLSVFVSCCPKRMALTQGFSKGSKTCIWSKTGRVEEHRLGIFDGESLQGDVVCDAIYPAKHFCTSLCHSFLPQDWESHLQNFTMAIARGQCGWLGCAHLASHKEEYMCSLGTCSGSLMQLEWALRLEMDLPTSWWALVLSRSARAVLSTIEGFCLYPASSGSLISGNAKPFWFPWEQQSCLSATHMTAPWALCQTELVRSLCGWNEGAALVGEL